MKKTRASEHNRNPEWMIGKKKSKSVKKTKKSVKKSSKKKSLRKTRK